MALSDNAIPFLTVLFLISLIIIVSIHPAFQKTSSSGLGAKDVLAHFQRNSYKQSASIYAGLSARDCKGPKIVKYRQD